MAISRIQTARKTYCLLGGTKRTFSGVRRNFNKIQFLGLEVHVDLPSDSVHVNFHSTVAHTARNERAWLVSGGKLNLLQTKSVHHSFTWNYAASTKCEVPGNEHVQLKKKKNKAKFGIQGVVANTGVVNVFTDASATHGFGCVWDKEWAGASWSQKCLEKYCIYTDFLEAYAMLAAVEAWGHRWRSRRVLLHCDNYSVVKRFNETCKKKNKAVQSVFDRITALTEKYGFVLEVVDADKKCDMHQGTDGLSKGSLDKFLKYIPNAKATATGFPEHLDMIGRAFKSQLCFQESGSKLDKLPPDEPAV